MIYNNFQKNKGKQNADINMIYNTETKYFYHITVDEDNIEDDKLVRYTKEDFPKDLKKVIDIFFKYYLSRQKRKKNSEVKDENLSFNDGNSFTSTKMGEEDSLSNENTSSIISQYRIQEKSNLIYVRNIVTYKNVTLLYLSDLTIEAFFSDKVKILLSEINPKIEIIDEYNNCKVISTSNAYQNSNVYFTHRLKMIKNVMYNKIRVGCFERNKEDNLNQTNNTNDAS